MYWAILYLPQWPLEVFADSQDIPRVIVEKYHGKMRITHLNEAALKHGVNGAMNLADAQALSPNMVDHQRDLALETKKLLTFAEQWRHLTPNLSIYNSQSLLLNMSRCIKLWGGLEQSIKKTIVHAKHVQKKFGYQLRVVWANTPMAACFLAQSKMPSGYYPIDKINKLKLECLPKDDSLPQLEVYKHRLTKMGIFYFEQLIKISPQNIAQYFHQSMLTYLNKILGKEADPRNTIEFSEQFSEQLDLSFPIKNKETLMFFIKRLLSKFCAYLKAQQKLALAFTIEFKNEDEQLQYLEFTLSQPQKNQEKMHALVLLKTEKLNTNAPIIWLKLIATHTVNYHGKHQDFWGSANQTSEQQHELLNRLYTKLGADAVHSIVLETDHRPEKAWSSQAFKPSRQHRHQPALPRRPTWLLKTPKPLNSIDQRPNYHGKLRLIYGPERIESGWWENNYVARDYYIARHTKGHQYWIFKPLKKTQGQLQTYHDPMRWYLHGIFS